MPRESSEPEVLLTTPRFRVVRKTRTTPDGADHKRDIIEHPGAVVVLPMVDANCVCLIRNYRVAAGETLIELPAGTLDAGELPIECARRELAEETGYRAAHLEKLHEFYLSPGILNELMRLFLATGLTLGKPELESGEEIETLVVSWDEAMEMARDGRIKDAKTLTGLLYYDRFRRRA